MEESNNKQTNNNKKKEDDAMLKKIDKSNITGLTNDKKEILKSLMGTVTAPLDLNKMREELKYGKN